MTAAPGLRRLLVGGLVPALLAWALALGVAAARAATPTACPASFQVLHDNQIGALQLPQGSYNISVTGIACHHAVSLFAAFLEHPDGRLPEPWRYNVQAVGTGSFIGADGQEFSVAQITPPGSGGPPPATGLVCPQAFTLTQPDRVGPLSLTRGSYAITRLNALSPSCADAAALLGQFLEDFDGKLPDGWVVLPNDAAFVRESGTYGFRLERRATGSGGLSFPTRSARCPATFRVLHNVGVAGLTFPAGGYWVNVLRRSGVSCREASSLFAFLLRQRAGRLPRPWVLDRTTGTFRRGRNSTYRFQAKPTFLVA